MVASFSKPRWADEMRLLGTPMPWTYHIYKLRLHYIYTSQDDKITSDALSRCQKNHIYTTPRQPCGIRV